VAGLWGRRSFLNLNMELIVSDRDPFVLKTKTHHGLISSSVDDTCIQPGYWAAVAEFVGSTGKAKP
jgi:hypothetical protein